MHELLVNAGYLRSGYKYDRKFAAGRIKTSEAIERGEQAVYFLFLDDQLGTKINDLRSLRLARAFVHASSFYRMAFPVPEIRGKRFVNEVN